MAKKTKKSLDTDRISVQIAGLKFKSPLILASGILGISSSSMHVLADMGIGGVTTKSIGPRVRLGYSNPSIIGLGHDTFLNSVGLANPGINEFVKEIPEIKQKQDLVVIVSVFGDGPEGYADIAERAWKAGADAIELNISCPHAEVSSIGSDPGLTFDFVKAVRSRIKCPLFVKLNPNITDINIIAKSAEKAGADAIVAINTVRGLAIDINTFRPILSHGTGGLSGRAIKPIGLKDVFSIYKAVKIPIIGCGGIFEWQDVVEYFLAGASAVQIGSSLYQGYEIISKINQGLLEFLDEKPQIVNISKLTGKAHEFQVESVPK
jgi:dihydroorotate dehydrogenase (NAD+) catalytic subunit